jgi:hypothetical protein
MYPPATPAFRMIDTNQTLIDITLESPPCRHTSSETNSSDDDDMSMATSRPWFEVPLDTFNAFRLGIDVGLVGTVCLFGFVGNALTIATLREDNHHRKRTTNWLLQVA